jgi:ankyrin repeat protein
MNVIRILLAVLLLSAHPARAGDDSDWAMFGRIVALVQPFLRLAVQSDDPRAVDKGIDSALAGENAEVNRLAREMADEMFEGMPADLKTSLGAMARDAAALARKERALSAGRGDSISAGRAVQARKELTAMGLRYYDAAQFLDAVKRDDGLAVELYVIGRGVNLAARDADGRSALEIARASRNPAIVRLLETAG